MRDGRIERYRYHSPHFLMIGLEIRLLEGKDLRVLESIDVVRPFRRHMISNLIPLRLSWF